MHPSDQQERRHEPILAPHEHVGPNCPNCRAPAVCTAVVDSQATPMLQRAPHRSVGTGCARQRAAWDPRAAAAGANRQKSVFSLFASRPCCHTCLQRCDCAEVARVTICTPSVAILLALLAPRLLVVRVDEEVGTACCNEPGEQDLVSLIELDARGCGPRCRSLG